MNFDFGTRHPPSKNGGKGNLSHLLLSLDEGFKDSFLHLPNISKASSN
jgi:hypothetical protein